MWASPQITREWLAMKCCLPKRTFCNTGVCKNTHATPTTKAAPAVCFSQCCHGKIQSKKSQAQYLLVMVGEGNKTGQVKKGGFLLKDVQGQCRIAKQNAPSYSLTWKHYALCKGYLGSNLLAFHTLIPVAFAVLNDGGRWCWGQRLANSWAPSWVGPGWWSQSSSSRTR